jgi:hypothetical protein
MCSGSETTKTLSDNRKLIFTKASSEIVSNWKGCMASEGSHASFRFGDTLKIFSIELRRTDFRGDIDDEASVSFAGAPITCVKQKIEQDSFDVKFKGGTVILCTRQTPEQETAISIGFTKSPPVQMFIGPAPGAYDSEPYDSDPPPMARVASGYNAGCAGYCESKPVCIDPKEPGQLFDLESIKLQRQDPSGNERQFNGTLVERHPKKICFKAWASAYDGNSSAGGGYIILRVNVKTPRKP